MIVPAIPALRRLRVLFGMLLLLLPVLAPSLPSGAAPSMAGVALPSLGAPMPAVLAEFSAREAFAREQLPAIITAAEAAAGRIVGHPNALINVPYGEQQTFAEEILNRAGGLANALPDVERSKLTTPDDIALLAVRAWAVDGPKMITLSNQYKARGNMVILFASRQGMPEGVQYDYLIDNGGGPNKAASAMNAIANTLNAWLWTSEYTSALTRLGKYPGILQSMVVPGSTEFNQALQKSGEARRFLGDCDMPIPAGELAGVYLKRVDLLIAELQTSTTRRQIDKAATLIADRLQAGKTVGVASCEHFLLSDIFNDNKTPWKPFNVVWRAKEAFPQNVKEGDLIVFFGYIGLSTVSEDYAAAMRGTKADIIASYIIDYNNPANNATEGLCVIEQHWHVGDTEVKLPFPPGSMAPTSGLESALIYRMLDDAASEAMKR